MRITKATGYAILAVTYLAKKEKEGPVGLGEIAKKQKVPKSFLAKIAQILTRAGIVRSHRGLKGGFSLARPASSITVREIIERIEGPIALEKCTINPKECFQSRHCALHKIWKKAQNRLVEVLDGTSVADLVKVVR